MSWGPLQPRIRRASTADAVSSQQSVRGGILASALTVAMVVFCSLPSTAENVERGPSGAPYQRVFIYEDDAPSLVPSSYRVAGIEGLSQRLQDQALSQGPDTEHPQLVRSEYWASFRDGVLESNHPSHFEFSCQSKTPQELNLGPVNIALSAAANGTDGSPENHLFSVQDGDLHASIRGDCKLPIHWSLLGTRTSQNVFHFDLQIPRSGFTTFYIDLPIDFRLQSDQAIWMEIDPKTTPLNIEAPSLDRRWYKIEAENLDRFGLDILPHTSKPTERVFSVRRRSISYHVSTWGMRWETEMEVEQVDAVGFPLLDVGNATVVDVKVDEQPVKWVQTNESGRTNIQIITAPALDSSTARSRRARISITGVEGRDQDLATDLALPRWKNCRVILIDPIVNVRVELDQDTALIELQSPDGWKIQDKKDFGPGASWYQFMGPSRSTLPLQIRTIPRQRDLRAEATLQLDVGLKKVIAIWNGKVDVAPGTLRPIELMFENHWKIESITVLGSDRVIDVVSELEQKEGQLTIWPEPEEVKNGALQLRVVGTHQKQEASTDSQVDPSQIPATWFVRLPRHRVKTVAALQLPSGWRWSGDSVLKSERTELKNLNDFSQRILKKSTSNQILFNLFENTTPTLRLVRPLLTIAPEMTLHLAHEGEQLVETLKIQLGVSGNGLSEIRVRTGPRGNRPRLVWSIEGPSATPSIVSRQVGPEAAIWILQLPREFDASVATLVGRRRYPLVSQQVVGLPSVAQAMTWKSSSPVTVNQQASVLVDGDLQIDKIDGPVLWVPVSGNHAFETKRLRYDPSEPLSIRLRPRVGLTTPTVVWEENVQVHLSVRSDDTIIAEYKADGHRPLEITHEPTMILEEVSVAGKPLVPADFVSSPRSIVIPAAQTTQTIRVKFRRPITRRGLFRYWNPPRLAPTGVVLRSEWLAHSAADTAIINKTQPLIGNVKSRPKSQTSVQKKALGDLGLRISKSDRLSLVATDLVWGILALVAMGAFAVAWWLVNRWTTLGFGILGLSAILATCLPINGLVVLGFLTVPMVAGGLLHLSIKSRKVEQELWTQKKGSESGSFSITRKMIRPTLILIAVGLASQYALADDALETGPSRDRQQSPHASSQHDLDPPVRPKDPAPPAPHLVIIPVDADGKFEGSNVWIPEKMHAELFPNSTNETPQTPLRFHSADYQLELEPDTSDALVRLEVRLNLQTAAPKQRIQLPFPAASVRSVERIADDNIETVRWVSEKRGISLSIPHPGQTQLRIVIEADSRAAEIQTYQMEIPIPPVVDSKLTLTTDASLQVVDIDPCKGRIQSDLEDGRVVADLGAVDLLKVQWRFRNRQAPKAVRPIVRRWMIHAGWQQTVTECETDLSSLVVAPYDQVQVDVTGEQTPNLSSAGWKLEQVEKKDASRQRLTFTALAYPPPPLRLVWEQTIDNPLGKTSKNSEWYSITIPEMKPVRTVPMGPSLVAVDAAPTLSVVSDTMNVNKINPKDFLASWSFPDDKVDWAFIRPELSPPLTVIRMEKYPWTVEESQHLHLDFDGSGSQGRMDFSYTANIVPGTTDIGPLRLILPAAMRVRSVEIGRLKPYVGAQLVEITQQRDDTQELLLPLNPRLDHIDIALKAWMPSQFKEEFRPPKVVLAPIKSIAGTYLVTRSSGIAVEQVQSTNLSNAKAKLTSSQRLSKGMVKQFSWQLDPEHVDDTPFLVGRLKTVPNPTKLKATQITDLSWQDGRWLMETIIDVQKSQGRIDFLTIEMPTEWTDDLFVSPSDASLKHPVLGTSKSLIRFIPREFNGRQRILIRGRLINSDSPQVLVPEVRLLGDSEQTRYIGVPSKLTSDPIHWDIVGARRVEQRPPQFNSSVTATDDQLVYQVDGSWSANLQTSNATQRRSRVTVYDVQLFPQQDGRTLAICRWDLLPGDKTSVQIRLPDGVDLLGQWSAGISANTVRQGNLVSLSLNLTQLAQPIELLVRFQQSYNEIGGSVPIPKLQGIPVDATWVARYRLPSDKTDLKSEHFLQRLSSAVSETQTGKFGTASGDTPGSTLIRTPLERNEALTRSIVTVLAGSTDSLAQRPAGESEAWLRPWLARANRLMLALPETKLSQLAFAPIVKELRRFDADIRDPIDRATSKPHKAIGLHHLVAPYHGAITCVASLPPKATSIPRNVWRPQSTWRLPNVRLSLLVVLCVLFAFFLFRMRHIAINFLECPEFWLLLLGVAGCLFIPLSVALTVCFLAAFSLGLSLFRQLPA